MSFRCQAAVVLLLLLLAGCGPLIPASSVERQYFILNDPEERPPALPQKSPHRLLVRDTVANSFINSHKIIYTDDPQLYRFYSLARWVERPTDRFTSLVARRLSLCSCFASVSHLAGAALGDLQLNTELLEFHHDAQKRPGRAKVRLAAELIDLRKREVIGQEVFDAVVPVESYDARGAVTALSTASSDVLARLTQWTASIAAEHAEKQAAEEAKQSG